MRAYVVVDEYVGNLNDENQHIQQESLGKKYMLLVIHNIWLVSPVFRFIFCNYPDQRNSGSNGCYALQLLILVSAAGAYVSAYCLLTYKLQENTSLGGNLPAFGWNSHPTSHYSREVVQAGCRGHSPYGKVPNRPSFLLPNQLWKQDL